MAFCRKQETPRSSTDRTLRIDFKKLEARMNSRNGFIGFFLIYWTKKQNNMRFLYYLHAGCDRKIKGVVPVLVSYFNWIVLNNNTVRLLPFLSNWETVKWVER